MIQEIAEKIWRIEGKDPGPTVIIFGGIHGNERTGIEVISQLVRLFSKEEKTLGCGTLFLIHGNPQAMAEDRRFTKGGVDLNRQFNERLLSAPLGSAYEERRAREIAPILRTVNICIDIHATIKPSVPFLACSDSPEHERVYRWFFTDRVLTDPHHLLGGEPVTTDEFLDTLGGIGICFESGWVQEQNLAQQILESCLNVLRDQGMVEGEKAFAPPSQTKRVYEMVERMDLTPDGFRFADGFGTHSFQPCKAGEIIGFVGDAPRRASEDGVIVFPKSAEYWQVGSPVGYFAKRVK